MSESNFTDALTRMRRAVAMVANDRSLDGDHALHKVQAGLEANQVTIQAILDAWKGRLSRACIQNPTHHLVSIASTPLLVFMSSHNDGGPY